MSSLAEALQNPPVRKIGFELWLSNQTEDMRDILVAAARDDRWTTNALYELLTSDEYKVPVARDTFRKWRANVAR